MPPKHPRGREARLRLLDQAKALIARRRYREALKLLKGIRPAKSDLEVYKRHRHLKGLASARFGDLEEARKIGEELEPYRRDDSEIAGFIGRLHMDDYDRTGDVDTLKKSLSVYHEGYDRWRDVPREALREEDFEAWREAVGKALYLGINAAAKGVFLRAEDPSATHEGIRAPEVIAREVHELSGQLPADARDSWSTASEAEAALILGDPKRAAELYASAVRTSPDERGSHASMWLQAKRLMNAMQLPSKDQALVWRAFGHLTDAGPEPGMLTPPHRRLRVYAFDPGLARRLDTAVVNQVTLHVPWERLPWTRPENDGEDRVGEPRLSGPVGEYLEIVDYDPSSGCFYPPVDLDAPSLLAMDGLSPAEGDPRFHQQMVYAVAMNVIVHFEQALGRPALWSPRPTGDHGRVADGEYVPRLRVYPHALRMPNAYYSPEKKALLFGYFEAETDDPDVVPGARVFTCLSHDVIAHEMAHALLDGLHPRFAEPSNRDVLALHEAFSDLVALFLHFSHPAVLRHEIARARGNLRDGSMLGELAQEFGRAIGRYGALRSAIGEYDKDKGEWRRRKPDRTALEATTEPHARGAILVAAIFDAFLTIYDVRTHDLIRLATEGKGILEPGALHPDLVERLAREAAKSATHLLRMCIRALDYCPPVDVDFGDYLRALITSDVDMVPDDRLNYRVAIIEAFQRWGIYPRDVTNLSVESLVWRPPRGSELDVSALFEAVASRPVLTADWRPAPERAQTWAAMRDNIAVVERWLEDFATPEAADELGLVLSATAPASVVRRNGARRPAFEVTSVRTARRATPEGRLVTDLVVEIHQERRGYASDDRQREVDAGRVDAPPPADFVLRGGCTLLVDPGTQQVRYAITKHILSEGRLRSQRRYASTILPLSAAAYFTDHSASRARKEPFAMLHGQGG